MKLFDRAKIAAFRVTFDRGKSWIYYGKDAMLLAVGLKYLLNLTNLQIVLFTIPLAALVYALGWFDRNWGIWKSEARFGAEQITEFNAKLFKTKPKQRKL